MARLPDDGAPSSWLPSLLVGLGVAGDVATQAAIHLQLQLAQVRNEQLRDRLLENAP